MIIDHPAPGAEPQLRRLWQATFGDTDAFLDDFFRTAYTPSRCLCAREEEKIVAAVYWFGCTCWNRPIAYLYALAVAEACRGRGIGTVLMKKAHTVLEAQGYAGVLLVPQEAGLQALYARLGYVPGPAIREWHCHASDRSVSMQQLDALSYAAARRDWLPEGGIVQEGESLAFLQTQTGFWAGEGFLLAARREEDRLIALEILGSGLAAPHILHTLHCTEGTFRAPAKSLCPHGFAEDDPTAAETPCPLVSRKTIPQPQPPLAPRIYEGGGSQGGGESIPLCSFAMFRSLNQSSIPTPTYFAFAFD